MLIFNIISLLGGLAMFLYGMRLMGDSLKEGSSGTLKVAMEKVTNNAFKAFLLGIAVTAIIQSSTATIVITSGLVAAGIISLDQSLGIIIGANVGTTVTGQIIRLLDIDAGSGSILQLFQPSTLAPLALILGIVLIMFCKFKKSDNIGSIAIGFGILFSGLMNMTNSVKSLTESGLIEIIITSLSDNPFLCYLSGAGIAFVLQSSSATIGILQAFSIAGDIPFKAVYIMLCGIYLGDCVTTAIVCSIGAKTDARRVGIVNILFNLSETVLVLLVVGCLHGFGLLGNLWNMSMSPGSIANTNSVFNLTCAILLLPLVKVYRNASRKIVKDEPVKVGKYEKQINALNPYFFRTPALAFNSCYDLLNIMFYSAVGNIDTALDLIQNFDEEKYSAIYEEEDNIDHLTDCVDSYLVELSPHISEDYHVRILTQYHKVVSEFEHLGDYAVKIADTAKAIHEENIKFSENAFKEISLGRLLLTSTLEYTASAFTSQNIDSAKHIEPLEEVMDDLVGTLHDNHLSRLREGHCGVRAGILYSEILTNLSRISDTCSKIGVATIVRSNPGTVSLTHSYIAELHKDSSFNEEYLKAHDLYFKQLPDPTAIIEDIKDSKDKSAKVLKEKESKKDKKSISSADGNISDINLTVEENTGDDATEISKEKPHSKDKKNKSKKAKSGGKNEKKADKENN